MIEFDFTWFVTRFAKMFEFVCEDQKKQLLHGFDNFHITAGWMN